MIASIDDFKIRLKEVETLITYARANQRTLNKYRLFNKSAIVLLCSHFEVLVEAFICEHVDTLKSCYNSDNLPQYMKDNYINDTIKAYKDVIKPSKNQKSLKALFQLHDSNSVTMTNIRDLKLDMKYGFGKHGQEETEKLFKKFGFENFVNSLLFKTPFDRINSAIGIRNNILHQGSVPSLTHVDLENYKNNFRLFADNLEQHVLNNQLTYYGKVYYP